jgi:hypothetical protein
MRDATGSQPPKLLDEVREVLRLHHNTVHAEQSSVQSRGLSSRPDGGCYLGGNNIMRGKMLAPLDKADSVRTDVKQVGLHSRDAYPPSKNSHLV